MTFRLAPEASAAGYRLVQHETIGSTNVDAMERLKTGEAWPLWVVSRHQSRGRGRRGSAWQTQPGNLAGSVGLLLDREPAKVATLGFVAGLALARALDRCSTGGGASEARTLFQLKWPNDVLAHGDKLAGILLETEMFGQARAVVIGIGVNVAHAPDRVPYRATSLSHLGIRASAEDLFTVLSAEWDCAYRMWDEGSGFGAVREAWLTRAAGLGQPVSVRVGREVATGTFETIDGQGQLVLRRPNKALQTISAGEVHFGEAATVRPEVAA